MMDAGRHPNIRLMTNAEVTGISGKAGQFKVSVLRHARFVDEHECTGCGDCAEVCPMLHPNSFEEGLTLRHAIFSPFAQAVPSAYIRYENDCLGTNPIACGKCVQACQKNCIDLDMRDRIEELQVGAVIAATGIDYFDPREASEYGYTRYENVVNSIELERLLSPGGPTGGKLVRFTDGKEPRRISFIQCVGSRCIHRDIPYCSRICCMNAIKSALLIREIYPDAQIDIFYIDVRAFGKGFEQFYHRGLKQAKINFIRSKPAHIEEDPATKDLHIFYENPDDGKTEIARSQMVILSEALVPASEAGNLAGVLSIETDKRGFYSPRDRCGDPLSSTREGIFICGCATGPKDITDSIAEASGAAIRAAQYLQKDKLPEKIEEIPFYDFDGPPRTGVFICHCGSNIAGVVDVSDLVGYSRHVDTVVHAEDLLFACSESTQRYIQEAVQKYKLNRVVIAACTPRTHEPIFRETLRKIGLNPYLLEMANIRDQCSWVHQQESEQATRKARDLIRMAVAKVCSLEPLEPKKMEIGHEVLVIGGGIGGMETALQLSRRGYEVTLLEKEEKLGGWTSRLQTLYPSGKSGAQMVLEKARALYDQGVKILTNTNVTNISGYVGNFKIRVKSGNEEKDLKAGALVVATGFELYQPEEGEFGYKEYKNVITNMQLEQMLAAGVKPELDGKAINHVVFVQCVGSRGPEGLPECSRYCCQAAIKQAIALREKGVRVAVLNRDIRVYHHEAETMYREARAKGVIFVKYVPEKPPVLVGKKAVQSVRVYDRVLKSEIEIPADLLVLSVGMRPAAGSMAHLQQFLKIPKGQDGFVLEKHPKFGPVETNIQGVFTCGCVQGPKDISDTIAQANAVAGKVDALLSRATILMEPITSTVRSELCRACGTCIDVCEYGAISLTDQNGIRWATVNEALCEGCGTCATFCPTGAIDIRHFRDHQIEEMLKAFLGAENMAVT